MYIVKAERIPIPLGSASLGLVIKKKQTWKKVFFGTVQMNQVNHTTSVTSFKRHTDSLTYSFYLYSKMHQCFSLNLNGFSFPCSLSLNKIACVKLLITEFACHVDANVFSIIKNYL